MIPTFGRRVAALILACAALPAAMAADARFGMTDLMAMLAQVDERTAAFEETRRLALLTAPIVRRGTLHYVRPDRLEMRVTAPVPETTEIIGDRVRVESSDAVRQWDLAQQPVALAWIEAIRASLAGDAATLERHFQASLSGTRAAWNLSLAPRAPEVAAKLSRVDVRGSESQLTSIEIVETGGDRISVAISPQGKN